MATSLISPGVEIREIDLTTIVPNVSTTEGAIAGVFRWGPVGERILIDSEVSLVNRFQKPTNLNYETFFTAASFLAYGNQLFVSRAANTIGTSPSATCNIESGNTTVTLSTGNTSALEAGMRVISTSTGFSNAATISSITNSTAFVISSSAHAIANSNEESVQFISNTAFSAVANTGAVANLTSAIVKNSSHFTSIDGTFDTDVKFVARYPGAIGDSLRVSVCGNSSGYTSTINLASYGTPAYMTVNNNSNTANVDLIGANTDNSANATAIRALINVTDLIEVGNTLIGTQYMKVTALTNTATYGTTAVNVDITTTSGNTLVTSNNTTSIAAGMYISAGNNSLTGLIVNNVVNSTAFYTETAPTVSVATDEHTISPRASFKVNFEDVYSLAEGITYTSSNSSLQNLTRHWEFFNRIDSAPGQSDFQQNFGNTSINNDEIHVVLTDNDGKFTGVPGVILETYTGLSLASDAKTIDGEGNFWKDVINNKSSYMYAVNDISGATSNTALNLANSTLDVSVTHFGYGNDGKDESNISIGALTTAWDFFKSSEDVEVSLLMQGKARSTTLANYLIDNIAVPRQDCIVLVSPQKGDVVNNPGSEVTSMTTFRNSLRASWPSGSYGVLDSGYKYMYDRYNDLYRWVPMNGDVAGLCVATDRVTDPWYSPAGYNRGTIRNVVKLAFNPKQADRDLLYKNGINPVVAFPGQGTVLYGDKTLLSKPSAFDRINVRRLFITLEKAISRASKYSLFEFNDEFTRLQFKNLVVPFLRDVKGRRGVTDFLVVCDETNNPASVVDRNEFVADIYIKPARSINFIQLNFVAVPTGISFNEVVGRF
jgi:hypothetical protein